MTAMEHLTQFDPSADTYDGDDDFAKSLDVAYEHIRQRMANGGPGWVPKMPESVACDDAFPGPIKEK
jgi:hypothetical protein